MSYHLGLILCPLLLLLWFITIRAYFYSYIIFCYILDLLLQLCYIPIPCLLHAIVKTTPICYNRYRGLHYLYIGHSIWIQHIYTMYARTINPTLTSTCSQSTAENQQRYSPSHYDHTQPKVWSVYDKTHNSSRLRVGIKRSEQVTTHLNWGDTDYNYCHEYTYWMVLFIWKGVTNVGADSRNLISKLF